jgi:ribosomal protein L32
MSCVICADDRATTYSLGIKGTEVECPVCGKYEVSHQVERTREAGTLDQKELSDISVASASNSQVWSW